MDNQYLLQQLGWRHFFQQQLSVEEWECSVVARVIGHERSLIRVLQVTGQRDIPLSASVPAITVGDWLLLDGAGRIQRLLERSSVFMRKAAGDKVSSQLIAANIDTVFLVSSMNQDFNLNRIERYLALSHEAAVEPVIVLTRADCCHEPEHYVSQAHSLSSSIQIIALNSLDPQSVAQLEPWCTPGNTVAFLGSSGVGKSSLINTLAGRPVQRTQAIRGDDDKGRHTTTGRFLHLLPSGALLLDTPGMRELQLAACEHGVEETFQDIVDLASRCRFSDCNHENEPGCAVREAIESGKLDARRLKSFIKLMKEQAFNSASLAQRRERDRQFGRHVKSVLEEKQKRGS